MGGPSAPSSSFTPRPLQRTNSNNFTDPRGSYRPAISSSRRAAQAAVSSITHSQAAASDSDEGNDQEISDSEVSNDEEDENDSSTTRLSKDGRITAEHKRVINDLKNGILSSKSADENFPEYSRDLLISSDVTGKTLLHKLIAEYPTIKSSGVTNGMKGRDKASTAVKLCIKLIKWSPEILLAQELRDRETPLYVAFTMASKPSTKPPTRLIQKMLDLTIKRPSIKEALMVPCGTQEETCLHAAVRLSSEELKLVDFILEAKTIAESAEDKITLLRQKDKAGLTPLHYAVSLKFSDVQWQMIQKLTGAEDFPPEIFMDQDKENRTPLHLAAACTNTNLEHILGSSNRTTFADQSVVQRKLVEYIITKAPATLTMTDSTGASPYQYRVTTYPQQTEAISNPKPAHTLAHIRTVPPFETVLPKPMRSYKLNRPDRVPQTPVYGPGEAPGMDLTKVSSTTTSLNPADDDVSFYLIDQYMHLEDQNDTIKYLYGSCPDRHINFDIQEEWYHKTEYVEKILSKAGLKSLNTHWEPERILRYVAIPSYSKTRIPSSTDASLGRTDMVDVFTWLRTRNVRKIIEVIIDDTIYPPHSDESIEKALRNLQIEILDWKREDIDIDTLVAAVPNVRDLRLYCSGNKSVLRSWSGVDGLSRLQKLKRIHVVISQGIDSKERVQANVRFFEEAMANHNPEKHQVLTTEIRDAKDMLAKRADGSEFHYGDDGDDYEKSGLWFSGMKNFSRFLFGLLDDRRPPRIRVALIDDGVDGTHPAIANKIVKGISYNATLDGNKRWRLKSYCSAPNSHGTQMAVLICQVCPEVELYVARLNEMVNEDGRRQIDEESAVEAIKWAVKQKVDIISMSWTFERTETNGDAMERLREEIDKANKDQILMFSSTDDKGLTGPDQARVYPTCLKSQGIIRIGAATQSGAVSDWSGKEVDYVLPGENIEIDDPMSGHNAHLLEHPSSNASHHGHLTHPTATGSSYATALAAGVASMIIYCAEVALIHSKAKLEPGQAPIDRQYIRKWNRMKGAFSKMSVSQPGMPKYVKPWDHFATKYDRLDDEKAKEWLRGKVDELFNREK